MNISLCGFSSGASCQDGIDTGWEIVAKFVDAVDLACVMSGGELRLTTADRPSGGIGIPGGFEVDEGVADHVGGCVRSVEMGECFIDEARRGLAVAAFGAGRFRRDAPACDVFGRNLQELKEATLAGIDLLNREVAAADAGLIRQNEKGNALVDEAMHRFFDAGQELDLIGLADVVDVADQSAVAVGKDGEFRSGIGEAWVEPDVVHIRGLRGELGADFPFEMELIFQF